MRYGIAHNVHEKNEGSGFTRQPRNMMELVGNPLSTGKGKGPILEEGYSYQGGEGKRAVGEVGVSVRKGAGRDGMHHTMERRTVYEDIPDLEVSSDDGASSADPEPQAPPPPAEPEKSEGHQQAEEDYESHFEDGNPWEAADPVRAYMRAFEDAKAIGQEFDSGYYMRRLSKDKLAAVNGYTEYLGDMNRLNAYEQDYSARKAINRVDELGAKPPSFDDPRELFEKYRDELKEDFD